MKHKIRMLSIAMATIVLISMVAATGVSAAPTTAKGAPTVGAPTIGGPALLWDPNGVGNGGTDQYWHITQGAPTTGGLNIYYMNFAAPGTWKPLGTGTNPAALAITGAPSSVIIMANGPSGIWAKTTTDGTHWSNVNLPSSIAAAGTGPCAVYDPNNNQIDVFFVASGTNHLMEDSLNLATATNTQIDLGGVVFATPAAAWTPNTAGMAVVVKGTGGIIYEKMFAMASWGAYTKFCDGTIGAGASLALDPGTDNVYLFVAGQDTHLYALQSTNDGLTWRVCNPILRPCMLCWCNLGGILTSAPAVSGGYYGAAGHAFVEVRGSDCCIWEFTVTGACTGTWHFVTCGP